MKLYGNLTQPNQFCEESKPDCETQDRSILRQQSPYLNLDLSSCLLATNSCRHTGTGYSNAY